MEGCGACYLAKAEYTGRKGDGWVDGMEADCAVLMCTELNQKLSLGLVIRST
jgi:hypothetical protein